MMSLISKIKASKLKTAYMFLSVVLFLLFIALNTCSQYARSAKSNGYVQSMNLR
jgi:hypothetical protein